MPDRVEFAVIGAGSIAQSYARAFERTDAARVSAVAELREPARVALAERLDCAAFEDYRELFDRASCEAVLICTPPSTHAEIAGAAIANGVNVLCEKPLTLESSTARSLLEAANRAELILTMASKFRFVPDIVEAKSILSSGALGEVALFHNTFSSRVDMATRWNSDPAVSGGGVVIDNGTHSVDLARYLLGPIVEVQAVRGRDIQNLPVEDSALLTLRTASGALGIVDLSWTLEIGNETYLTISGSDGTLRLGWSGSRSHYRGKPGWEEFGTGYDKVTALQRQIENVAAAIRGEEDLLVTGEDAVASVEVIEQAYESLRERGWRRVGGAGRPTLTA